MWSLFANAVYCASNVGVVRGNKNNIEEIINTVAKKKTCDPRGSRSMRDNNYLTTRTYRSVNAFLESDHASIQSIIAFAQLHLPWINMEGNTVMKIAKNLTDEQRFIFLACITWFSTLHHSGDAVSNRFSEHIDEIECGNHPGLLDGVTDCIQSSEAYAYVVGQVNILAYTKPVTVVYEDNHNFRGDIMQIIDSCKGIWNLSLLDGIPVHELVLHSFTDKYRIVQSNVGRYTMSQFCFHIPTSPNAEKDYGIYGLPYNTDRTHSTRDQLNSFLDNIKEASDIGDFFVVELKYVVDDEVD